MTNIDWLTILFTIPAIMVGNLLFYRTMRKKEYTAEQVDNLLDTFNKRMEILEFKVDNPQPIKVGDRYRVFDGSGHMTKSEALKNSEVYVVTDVYVKCDLPNILREHTDYTWMVKLTNTETGELLEREAYKILSERLSKMFSKL